MTTGYGLSAAAIELYNLLIAFGWTAQKSYTFAQKYDSAYDANGVVIDEGLAMLIDDTLSVLEKEYVAATGGAGTAEAPLTPTVAGGETPVAMGGLWERANPAKGSLAFYPVDFIKTQLLAGVTGNARLEALIADTQNKDKVYNPDGTVSGGLYGLTLDDWATVRANQMHYGYDFSRGGLQTPSPEIVAFEDQLKTLNLRPDQYARAYALRKLGDIPLVEGGSTEEQKIYAAQTFLGIIKEHGVRLTTAAAGDTTTTDADTLLEEKGEPAPELPLAAFRQKPVPIEEDPWIKLSRRAQKIKRI